MRASILIIGNNILPNEAIQYILKGKGYQVSIGTFESAFGDGEIDETTPDITIWQEDLLKIHDQSIFRLSNTYDILLKSIFILSARTLSMFGMGLTKGIKGYVHKKGGIKELEKCISAVDHGSIFISPLLVGTHQIPSKLQIEKKEEFNVSLTTQEEKILRLVKQKKTSREIASLLNISPKTVQNHRQNMSNKLGLKGRGRLYEFSKLYFEHKVA